MLFGEPSVIKLFNRARRKSKKPQTTQRKTPLIDCDLITLNTNDCGSFGQFSAGFIRIPLVFRMDNTRHIKRNRPE